MSNSKYCIQRKDLLESNQKVPVGTMYMTIDKPTEYKWLTDEDFFIKVNGEWHFAESIDFDFIESNQVVSNSKHTPAPWRVSNHVDNGETVIRSKDGDIIANLDCDNVNDFMDNPKQETKANARLIAAAPDLLEALITISKMAEEGVIHRAQTGKPHWSLVDELKLLTKKAIRKATEE